MYINGVRDSTTATDGTALNFGTCPLFIGVDTDTGCASGLGNWYSGKIDDPRVYNRALSQDEITQLYQQGATTKHATTITAPRLDDVNSGLVGHWTFDGKDMPQGQVNDTSGNGNNGSMRNMATSSAYARGVLGQALTFDKVNDFVDIPAPSVLQGLAAFTVSLWAKSDSYQSLGGAFSIYDGTTSGTLFLIYPYDPSNGNGTRVYFNSGAVIDQNDGAIADGKWHHFLFVSRSATDHELFVDGVSVATSTISKTLPATLSHISIGAWRSGTQLYGGSIDDVRVYGRALSNDEIKQLYQMGQ
jgi:hypothetical protein